MRLPSYYAINASARYELTPELSLFLYGDNLTNSLGLTEGNPRAGELQSGDAGGQYVLGPAAAGAGLPSGNHVPVLNMRDETWVRATLRGWTAGGNVFVRSICRRVDGRIASSNAAIRIGWIPICA